MMRKVVKAEAWVVYLMTIDGKGGQMKCVCEQSEWDVMERERPGHHKLVRAHITNEAEAESLARGEAGTTPVRSKKR